MSDKEFLMIWELFKNIKTEEDKVFWINLVETSKTYKPGSLLFLLGETNHLQGACMYCTSKQPLYNSMRTI